MTKRPDAWTRFLGLFVRTDIEAKDKRTDDVIAHADRVRSEADRLMKLEYAAAEQKYRRR